MNHQLRIFPAASKLGWLTVAVCCTVAATAVAAADESRLPLPSTPARGPAEAVHEQRPVQPSNGLPRLAEFRSPESLRVVASSLAVVLGTFALLVVCLRKQRTAGVSAIMETLGTVQVAPKVQLHLVRLGSRLLLLHLTPGNVQRVAEVKDADEVQELLAAHKGNVNEHVSRRVGALLQGMDAAHFPAAAAESARR